MLLERGEERKTKHQKMKHSNKKQINSYFTLD